MSKRQTLKDRAMAFVDHLLDGPLMQHKFFENLRLLLAEVYEAATKEELRRVAQWNPDGVPPHDQPVLVQTVFGENRNIRGIQTACYQRGKWIGVGMGKRVVAWREIVEFD